MKFLQWNNIIARHFFNPSQAGKQVHLYLTKDDIIALAKPYFEGEGDDQIWRDFLNKVKQGLPGSSKYPFITDKAVHAHHKWLRPGLKVIDGVRVEYPLFVCYLVFFILPLVGVQDDHNANNYYDRLNDFLKKNHIDQDLHNRLREIDNLWSDLATWANSTCNGELGFFRVRNFVHSKWVYVGKVFSQCVFPPRAIKRLPELFFKAGMIPDSNYANAEIKRCLLQYGSTILSLPNNVIETIRKSDNDELGQSIIDTAKREYSNWAGESHITDEAVGALKRTEIFSRLYLQLQVFGNTGKIAFSYRMKSANELPDNLIFNGIEIREEKGGYSKTIHLPFKDSIQLHDEFNGWVARLPKKDVRLFTNAGSLQLSTDYWIETDVLSKTNWMYLLCNNSKRDQIVSWLKNECAKHEEESDYAGMPDGFFLFKFLNPNDGLDGIPELTIVREKSIRLTSALAVDFRTFTSDFLPEVEIVNSDGTEVVYLQYKNTEEQILLKKKVASGNTWLLPDKVSIDADFNVRVNGETFKENETTYKIVSSDNSAFFLDGKMLPKRNGFGRIVTETPSDYSKGINVVGINPLKQIPYLVHFRGVKEATNSKISQPSFLSSEGNLLLSFLTLRRTLSTQEFHSAFELLYLKYFGIRAQNNASFNFSRIKKASLNYFHYLGFLDYDYESKSIVVAPPQLILIPASTGRKVLLTGGRDISFVNLFIETASKFNLQVEIVRQFPDNEDLLLPDAITLRSFGSKPEGYGEKEISEFAKALGITFNPSELPQINLQELSVDIDTYSRELIDNRETNLTYEDWAGYIFNTDTLHFDMLPTPKFDKASTLLEYRLRPWEFYLRIWINQKCYEVDKNWGRYLVLDHCRKSYILLDAIAEKVGIPVDLPLPRLLAKSLLLLSGLAPNFKFINGKSYRIYENIPSDFIQNVFKKMKQKTIASTL